MYTNDNLFVFAMGVFNKKIGDDKRYWIPKSKQPLCDFLSHKLPWQTMQPIWSKDFLIKIDGFDESFMRLQDVEIHTRALLNPHVKYRQFTDIIDCYYRIDEERKSFNAFTFLNRWMASSVMYCNKFENCVPKKIKHYLYGTIFKSQQQIIYYLKQGKITKSEYNLLERELFSCKLYYEAGVFKQRLFKLSYLYNLNPIRIPGINMILFKLIIT